MTRRPLSDGSAGDASAVRASAAGVPNTVETPTAIGGGAGRDVSSGAAAAAAISDAQSWANVVGNDDRTFVRPAVTPAPAPPARLADTDAVASGFLGNFRNGRRAPPDADLIAPDFERGGEARAPGGGQGTARPAAAPADAHPP